MKTILQYLTNNFKFIITFLLVLIFQSIHSIFALTSDFSILRYDKCAPTVVTFTNKSINGTSVEYLWDFGKGAIIASQNKILTEAFSNPGTYIITLSAVEGTDTVRSSQTLEIANKPQASFVVDIDQGCIPLQVAFSSTSTEGDAVIETTFWDFRNGDTGSGNNLNYSFNQSGLHTVFMSVTDVNGCSDYYEAFELINVFSLPIANFYASDSFACLPPLAVNFTNVSNGYGRLTSHWEFGNNTSSDDYYGSTIYSDAGLFDVSLHITDANGCVDSITREQLINVGGITGEIYIISAGNTYTEYNSLICPGTIEIGSTLPGQTDYKWIIDYNGDKDIFEGIESIPYQVPDSGRIDITLIYGMTTECPDSIKNSFLVDHIVARFNMSSDYTCQLPADIELTNTSDNAVSFQWQFPNGSTSSDEDLVYSMPLEITHNYLFNHELNDFSGQITLVAENENGCSDSISHNYNAILPVARFMPDKTKGCIPFEVTFSDSSKSIEVITEWTYLIDGMEFTSSNNDPFSYTFNTPGEFPVQLIIQNDQACTDTSYIVTIEVGDKIDPFFSVSPSNLCYGNTLNLNDESPSQDLIDSWQYSSPGLFNTGTITTPDQSVSIHPLTSGPKDITLTVEYNGCLSDTTLTDIFSVDDPAGYLDYRFSCDTPMYYTFLSEIENADELTWFIDDTSFTNIDSVNYLFEESGRYQVTIQATNTSSGCTMEKSIYVNVRNVHANFIIDPFACLYDSIELNSSSSIDYINECYSEGFLWDFGDGSPLRRNWDTIQQYAYFAVGEYDPQLIVYADNGCSDTIVGHVEVVQPPVSFSASPTSGCGPELTVNFDFDTIDSTIDEWIWYFGDNSSDTTQNRHPEHSYSEASYGDATYLAHLQVTDFYGCSNSTSTYINVYTSSIDFQAEQTGLCLGETANFLVSESDVTSFLWNFGDGDSSATENSHVYNETGRYSVRLTAVRKGCETIAIKPDYISVQDADAFFTMSDTVFECYPATVSFNHINTSDNIVEGIWTFANGSQSQEYSPQTEYTYSQPGIYEPSLYIRTSNNCISTSYHTIEVTGPEVEFAFDPAFICSGDSVTFEIIESDTIDEFRWIFGDGNTSTDANPTHVYYAQGEIYPGIWVRDGDCETTITDEVLYVSTIAAAFELMPIKENYCYNDSIFALNQSSDFNSSHWSVNGVLVSADQNLTGIPFEFPGEIDISLEISNAIGCHDTLNKTYNVVDLPQFSITGETKICKENNSTPLTIAGSPLLSVQWYPPEIFSSPIAYSTIASPDTSTYITAIASDINECSSSQSVLLTVIESPNLSLSPQNDTSIIIGETIQLIVWSDIDGSTYSWSPGYQISCTSCNDPFVRPFESTNYTVEITDECRTSSVDIFVEVIINHYLEFPTAFTPNGDNENDIFMFESKDIDQVEFKIFNRWGNLVFSSTSLTEGWDGYYSGKLQNTDTYTYYIRAITETGFEFDKKGTFLLIR